MRAGDEEALHANIAIYQVVQAQRKAISDAVRNLPSGKLSNEDQDGLIASLADQFSINVPILDESNINPQTTEIDIDLSRDRVGYPFAAFGNSATVKGTEIAIAVPFTGDREIFRCHASSHTMNYPRARLNNNTVTFVACGTNLDPAQVRREFDSWLVTIKQHLQQMRSELGNFNESIKNEIASAVQERIRKLNRDDTLLAGLGFGGPKAAQ